MTKEAKKPFRQSVAEWRQFVYNPDSGEFLGRTAKSWGERGAPGPLCDGGRGDAPADSAPAAAAGGCRGLGGGGGGRR